MEREFTMQFLSGPIHGEMVNMRFGGDRQMPPYCVHVMPRQLDEESSIITEIDISNFRDFQEECYQLIGETAINYEYLWMPIFLDLSHFYQTLLGASEHSQAASELYSVALRLVHQSTICTLASGYQGKIQALRRAREESDGKEEENDSGTGNRDESA